MLRTTFLYGSGGTVQNSPVLTQLWSKGEKQGTKVKGTSLRPCNLFASKLYPWFPSYVLNCLRRDYITLLSRGKTLSLCPQVSRNCSKSTSTFSPMKTLVQLGWDPGLQSGPGPHRTVLRGPKRSQQWLDGPGAYGDGSFFPGSSCLPTFSFESKGETLTTFPLQGIDVRAYN